MQDQPNDTSSPAPDPKLGRGATISRREFLTLAAAAAGTFAVGGLAAACAPAPTPPPPAATAKPVATAVPAATAVPTVIKPKSGGKVTWGIEQDPTNLVPYGAVATENHWGKEPMYESLVTWDKNLIVQPSLAEKWETPDDKTWIWRLRQGIKFHNGQEVTAEDVKYSMDMQAAPPPPGITIAQYPSIVSTEVVDKYTVKFNMKGPDPTVLGYLAWERYSPIVPKDMYKTINPTIQGIGTGPFQLAEYVQNDRVVFTRNKNYWKPGLPYLDDLILKILPDENARVAALRSGVIDGCSVTADTSRSLKNDPNITVLSGLFSAPNQIQFTIRKEGNKPLHKKAVRQAMNMAINRQDVIDRALGGEAVYSGNIPPGYGDWFIPEAELKTKFYKYDAAGAKKLLADAGYPNGFSVTMYIISNPPHPQIAEVLKEQWKQVGIEVTLVAEEITTFAKRNGEGNFDICLTGRGMRHDPSGYINEIGRPTAGWAATIFDKGEGWKNDEAIQLYDKLVTTLDSAQRHAQVRRIQEIGFDEFPQITLFQTRKFIAVRNYLKDMYVAFTDFYSGLRTAWLDK